MTTTEPVTHGDIVNAIAAATGKVDDNSGIRALVNSTVTSHDRLPMLDVVYDRLVRSLSTSLRNFTGDNIDVSIESMAAMRFSQYMESMSVPSIVGIFEAIEWGNLGLINPNSSLIYTIVDVLLGGRRSISIDRSEAKSFTTIETNLVRQMLTIIMNELGEAFAPICSIQFKMKELETNPRFAAIVTPTNIVSVATIKLGMEGRGGHFTIALPYATMEPVREQLLQRFIGERMGHDNIWEQHLETEILKSYIPVEAIVSEQSMNLRDVLRFQVGQHLLLQTGSDDPVEMRSNGHTLGKAKMGRNGSNFALCVTEMIGR